MNNKQPHWKYVSIKDIIPNPNNPRRNSTDEISKLKRILLEEGWKMPLTVYLHTKTDTYEKYILQSGHRRFEAAKEINTENPALMKEIPVFIVDKPLTTEDDLRSLSLLQSAEKNWTTYEWAKLAHTAWENMKKPSYKEIGYLIGQQERIAAFYIDVFRFYPREEIEAKLENGDYQVRALAILIQWLRKFEEYQKELYNQLGANLIRKYMLNKFERKTINANTLAGDKFVQLATTEEMKEFLFSNTLSLRQCQGRLGVDKVDGLYSNWKSDVQKMAYTVKMIIDFPLKEGYKIENFEEWLDKIYEACKAKKKEITKCKETYNNDLAAKT
jgi:hypothetical protein